MTDQSRLQRALDLAGIHRTPNSSHLTEAEQVERALLLSNAMFPAVARILLHLVDEREEQVHPIARPLFNAATYAVLGAGDWDNPGDRTKAQDEPAHPAPPSEVEATDDDVMASSALHRADAICANCGRTWGVHAGRACPGQEGVFRPTDHALPPLRGTVTLGEYERVCDMHIAKRDALNEMTDERDTLRARCEDLRSRLVTITDEACGLQPVDTSDEDLFTLLEKGHHDWRIRASSAEARIQQLEGELAESHADSEEASKREASWLDAAWEATGVAASVRGLTTLDDVVRVQREDLTTTRAERDTLRVEVNRLNAEAFELRRKLEAQAGVSESAEELIEWYESNGVDSLPSALHGLFGQLHNSLYALDQPSDPKTEGATE